MYVAQAIWEKQAEPSARGPMGRALAEVRRLSWISTSGWWAWEVPDQDRELHFVYHSPSEVGHVIRESMQWEALRNLERRRPRQYAGIGAGPSKPVLRRVMESFKSDKELNLAQQVLAGAVWTGERARRRGLTQEEPCPYCGEEAQDEEHIFWTCS